MPRKGPAPRRPVDVDPVYGSGLLYTGMAFLAIGLLFKIGEVGEPVPLPLYQAVAGGVRACAGAACRVGALVPARAPA